MSPAVTAESFWNAFADTLRKRLAECDSWRSHYTSDAKWTEFMNHTVLDELGKNLGFEKISWEWCRIDVGYFGYPQVLADSNPDRVAMESHYNPDWDWEVAIEHENNGQSWLDEFTKLGHINCGLKVLITYHDYVRPLEAKIAPALTLYKGRKYRQSEDRWLLIFGPSNKWLGAHDFVAYSFDGERLAEMPPKRILPQDSSQL